MVRWVGRLLGLVFGIAVSAFALLLVGMRTKSPRVLAGVRRMNRSFTNPRVLPGAGTAGSSTDVVRHVGRVSGRSYATPVQVVETDDGFAVALPYGPHSDWLANVLAAGTATIVHDGVEHSVERPAVVPMSTALDHFAPREQRLFRLFRVEDCLVVHRSPAA